jgi:hypothetical protein
MGFIEPGRTPSEVFTTRRGMLPSAATWVCARSDGFLVVFPYQTGHPYAAPRSEIGGFEPGAPVDTLRGSFARVVRIRPDLGGIEMRHTEFVDSDAVWRSNGCIERGSLR